MSSNRAFGVGIATLTDDDVTLDTWFPNPRLGDPGPDDAGTHLLPEESRDEARRVHTRHVTVTIDLDVPPTTPSDAYLRLHLLSHRLVLPNTINLDNIFSILNNVVWTSAGPCSPDAFETTRAALITAGRGPVHVHGVDKFPAMLDYVVPSGVRIADASRVRLGAHLAPGTTVMHEGFCNYNAGTLGASMIEGRISQGVIVDDGADVGGGASIMGTLSGGGQTRISIGPRSLLGANAGLGISLGADCVVEAGLYLTAGTKLTLVGWTDAPPTAKARDLSGRDNVLYRRNSLTGAVEALPRQGQGIALNTALHTN